IGTQTLCHPKLLQKVGHLVASLHVHRNTLVFEFSTDAERLYFSKVANILTNRQHKQQRETAQDIVRFRQQYQQPPDQREFDLNDSERYKNMSPEEAQMMIPGLAGEDPNSKDRQQRQREQLRDWLIQQQAERDGERHRQKMEGTTKPFYGQYFNNTALELQNLEMENRKATVIATKDYNLAMVRYKKQQRQEFSKTTEVLDFMDDPVTKDNSPQSIVDIERRETLKLKEFQKAQIEEKERNEEHYYDRIRIDSARAATLIERQQAKLNKQMRKHLDSTNLMLAETRRQLGAVSESFFSQFNTCSR
uniref:RIB43A domain with coiled-coils 2 n=1 Tax=Neogobius melanostomus TaxID=47308 RepID=A0A8C6SH29_9GOBI